MADLDLRGKRVLIREDLNVPVKNGVVTSDLRIKASLPTIELALKSGAAVMLMSHIGRPTEGEYNDSLQPVASEANCSAASTAERLAGRRRSRAGRRGVRNVRFNPGEKRTRTDRQEMASLRHFDGRLTAPRRSLDVSKRNSHRSLRRPVAGSGIGHGQSPENPDRPITIVSGSSLDQIDGIQSLSEKIDQLIVGGGIGFASSPQPVAGRQTCKPIWSMKPNA
jgi:phosphoglycerate kinase